MCKEVTYFTIYISQAVEELQKSIQQLFFCEYVLKDNQKFGILKNFVYLCTIKSKSGLYEGDMYRAVADQQVNV